MTYQEFKEAVIRIASKMKVEDYELYYMESDSTSVEIFKEEVSGYETEESMGICFRCIVDGKAGYASTENLDEEEAESLVVRALENAASIEEEEPCFLHKKGDTYAKCEEVKESTPSGAELTDAAMCLQKEMYQADSLTEPRLMWDMEDCGVRSIIPTGWIWRIRHLIPTAMGWRLRLTAKRCTMEESRNLVI